LSDIADIDWGDDDDFDTMLSQVDMSALCEQEEIVTNTQRSDPENVEPLTSSCKENQASLDNDESLVTESWDFDDEELIQTLEQVERTQCNNINDKASHVKVTNVLTEKSTAFLDHSNQPDDFELFQTLEHVEKMHNIQVKMDNPKIEQYQKTELGSRTQTSEKMNKQNVNFRQATVKKPSVVEQSCSQVMYTYSKEDIERKRLEAQQKRKQRLKLTTNRMNVKQNTYRSKR